MDKLDRRILDELQRDASQTMEELAVRTYSTPATVHRRCQKLKASGVIDRIVAIVSPGSSGEPITVVLGVTIKSQRPKEQETFKSFIRRQGNIKMAWMTTGEFDYVLVGAFPDTAAYRHFIESDLADNVNFSHFRTFVSVEEVKFETARQFA